MALEKPHILCGTGSHRSILKPALAIKTTSHMSPANQAGKHNDVGSESILCTQAHYRGKNALLGSGTNTTNCGSKMQNKTQEDLTKQKFTPRCQNKHTLTSLPLPSSLRQYRRPCYLNTASAAPLLLPTPAAVHSLPAWQAVGESASVLHVLPLDACHLQHLLPALPLGHFCVYYQPRLASARI